MRALVLLTIAAAVSAEPNDSFLLRNVTVHPVSAAEIPAGAVLVLNGKIAAVGAKLSAPKGVRVIDGKTLHVYPGMIDAGSQVGLSEIGAVRETGDVTELGDFNPQLRAAVAVNPSSEHIPVVRANGITSSLALPQGSLVAGQASLMNLDGWTWEEMEVNRAAALHITFPVLSMTAPGPGSGRRPYAEAKRDYEARIRKLDSFFEQARRYQKAKAAPGPDFRTDLKLEAMLPVLAGKTPVMITAVRERAVRDALEFAARQKIRLILAGVREPGKNLEMIKARNIPVVLGPTLTLPLQDDSAYDEPSTLPAELYKAGIRFTFASLSTEFSRNLPYQAANAVAFGLPREEAIKALTLNAATILGAGNQLGSIEEGKWANLMLTDGDPLETKTQVKMLFIKGRPVDLDNKQKRLYEKYKARP